MLLFFIVVGLLVIALAGLSIGIFIKGKFPDTHIEHNRELKKMGISCAKNDSSLCQGQKQTSACEKCCFAR